MNLLANENFPRLAVEALRNAGHEVVWIRTEAPGSSDDEILQRAQAAGFLVLTFDKDFGELAFRWGLPANCGVVLFRLQPRSPEYVAERVLEAICARDDWAGNFFVVDDFRVRVRPLPHRG